MIVGIGADIIEIERIKHAVERWQKFTSRIFTPAERKLCLSGTNPAERFAGRFAAKEAVAKALGASLPWQDVEILSDEHGQPVVKLANKAALLAAGMKVSVTISHCQTHALAFAVAELPNQY